MKYFPIIMCVLLLCGCESDTQSDSIERKTYRFPSAPSIENTTIIEIEKAQFSDAAYYPDGVVMVVETQQELEAVYHNLFDSLLDPDPIPPDVDFEAYVVIAALGRNYHTSSDIAITAVEPLPSGGFAAQVEALYDDFGIAAITKAAHIVQVKKTAAGQPEKTLQNMTSAKATFAKLGLKRLENEAESLIARMSQMKKS